MNRYYLLNLTWVIEDEVTYSPELVQARSLAPSEGLPNKLFQCSISSDKTKAIVQAEWTDIEAMDALGTSLGELQSDGSAPQAVFDEQVTWEVVSS